MERAFQNRASNKAPCHRRSHMRAFVVKHIRRAFCIAEQQSELADLKGSRLANDRERNGNLYPFSVGTRRSTSHGPPLRLR